MPGLRALAEGPRLGDIGACEEFAPRGKALPEEDRESLRWVNEHGGLENVSDAWDDTVNLCATIGCEPNDASEMLQALGECTDVANKRLMPPGFEWTDAFADAVDFMDCAHDLLYTIDGGEHTSNEMVAEMVKRLMPEGMEWPRFEDGEPVKFGGTAPTNAGGTFTVGVIAFEDGRVSISDSEGDDWRIQMRPDQRVKRPGPKVLAGDGEPLEAGQTVWDKHGDELLVLSILDDHENHVMCHYEGTDGTEANGWWLPHTLTHAKHEHPDSWDRINEESQLSTCEYFDHMGGSCHDCPGGPADSCHANMMVDVVRRAKALAGVSE